MSLRTILSKLGIAKSAPTTTLDQMSAALHTSLVSISKDATPTQRPALIDQTLTQFRDALHDEMARRSLLAKAKMPPKDGGTLFGSDEDEDAMDDDAMDEDETYEEKAYEEDVTDEDETASASSDSMDDATDDSDEEDEDMNATVKKQYTDRIAMLEAKLRTTTVQKADIEKMRETIAKHEDRAALADSLAQSRAVLGDMATVEEVAKVAEQIRKGFDVSVLAPIAKQREVFAKAAMLTHEVGTAVRGGDSSPMAELAKAAASVIEKNDKLTQEQAIARALELNPSLYDAAIAR